MAASSDQCAVAADGSLLDASAITFYNDPDNNTPLPNPNSATKSSQLHPFFRGGTPPSQILAGSHRSTRIVTDTLQLQMMLLSTLSTSLMVWRQIS